MAEECIPSHCISNENDLHRSFGKKEVSRCLVRLHVIRYEAYVTRWDADEGGHVAVEFHGVSSQTGSIMTTRNGMFLHLEEASACIAVLRPLFPRSEK